LLNVEIEDQLWTKISNEVNKISYTEQFDKMSFVCNGNEIIGGKCVKDFTTNNYIVIFM